VKRLAASLSLLLLCAIIDLVALLWMAVALAANSRRGWRLALSHDQMGNVIAGGDEDEYISSRCWRNRHKPRYARLVRAIDWIAAQFGDFDHCRRAFESEQLKAAARLGWRFKS